MLLDVATELALRQLALVVGLRFHQPDVVVERKLGVDRDRSIGAHDRVDALARVERVLHLVSRGREPVAQQVLEQELAESPAGLRRPQSLLQPREVLRSLEHLRGGFVDLAETLVDLVRRLRCALESAVDLGVELSEPPVHRLGHPDEVTVDLRVPLGKLRAPVGSQLSKNAGKPDQATREEGSDEQDQQDVCHGLTDGRERIGRSRAGLPG